MKTRIALSVLTVASLAGTVLSHKAVQAQMHTFSPDCAEWIDLKERQTIESAPSNWEVVPAD